MVSTTRPTAIPTTSRDNPPHMQNIPTCTSIEIPLFVGETVLSVERRNGMVITTTVKVEVQDQERQPSSQSPSTPSVPAQSAGVTSAAPDSSEELTYLSNAESDQSMVIVDSSAPPPPNPVRSALPGPQWFPSPPRFGILSMTPSSPTRKSNHTIVKPTFTDGLCSTDIITRIVEGVPNARHKAFNNWDSALWDYAAAYQRVHPSRDGIYNNTPGYQPQILKVSAVNNPLAASYTFGSRPKVGEVDVQGLDLDANRLSYEVEMSPNA
ncbi:hypothetical protein V5O48_006996 [Marasmius crinis-equi]|uniref:Uncharacterized protein n=1 Tax=Marasmius crinis-equi TaxID=585013 RepID=A0ABR3FI12_9AGAR